MILNGSSFPCRGKHLPPGFLGVCPGRLLDTERTTRRLVQAVEIDVLVAMAISEFSPKLDHDRSAGWRTGRRENEQFVVWQSRLLTQFQRTRHETALTRLPQVGIADTVRQHVACFRQVLFFRLVVRRNRALGAIGIQLARIVDRVSLLRPSQFEGVHGHLDGNVDWRDALGGQSN